MHAIRDAALVLLFAAVGIANAADGRKTFSFDSQRQALAMHYFDFEPTQAPNGRTAVLLHGKNFCADYWVATSDLLRAQGFRVIVPEQIGFCGSSKPGAYQFSFHQLASNTLALLDQAGVDEVEVIGHSMGGMLAVRVALAAPDRVGRLVLVNPIGLEDWKAKGVPYRTVDAIHATERKSSYEGIARYQRTNYYAGEWKPAYERLARGLAAMYAGKDGEAYAWNAALTADMIFTQPVVHEFGAIAVPTTLIIGQRDRTAIGRDAAPKALADRLGDYPALGRAAAAAIPGARLVALDDLGHLPHIEDPPRFNEALLGALR